METTLPPFIPVRYEIVLIPGYAVCHGIDNRGTKCIVNLIEKPEDILFIPKDRPMLTGWKGRHIGWMAHPNAVVVRDDRFDPDPMPCW